MPNPKKVIAPLDRVRAALENLYSRHRMSNKPWNAGIREYHTDRFQKSSAEKWDDLVGMMNGMKADEINELALRQLSPSDRRAYERAAEQVRNGEFRNGASRRTSMLVNDGEDVLPRDAFGNKVTHNPFVPNSVAPELAGSIPEAERKKFGRDFATAQYVYNSPANDYNSMEWIVSEMRSKGYSDAQIAKFIQERARSFRR